MLVVVTLFRGWAEIKLVVVKGSGCDDRGVGNMIVSVVVWVLVVVMCVHGGRRVGDGDGCGVVGIGEGQ